MGGQRVGPKSALGKPPPVEARRKVRTLPKVVRPKPELASLVPDAKRTGPQMKFYVKHGDSEMMFPSLRDIQSMYRMKLIAPTDMVRRENSDRWTKASDLPELRFDPNRRQSNIQWLPLVLWIALGIGVLAMMVQFFGRMPPIKESMLNDPPATAPKK